MPTNDERREVAARLREIAPGGDWPDMTAKACGLNPQLMSNSFHEFTGELCERLADLIEPEPERTCRMLPTRDKPRSKALTLTCSNCGDWHEYHGDEKESKWKHCRNCGAKVVIE